MSISLIMPCRLARPASQTRKNCWRQSVKIYGYSDRFTDSTRDSPPVDWTLYL